MMLGPFNLPQSPFDMRPLDYSTPGIGDGVSQPAAPFVWGQGGARLSPEQIAREQDVAAALLASGSDTSPVGHWTQGLARSLNGLMGGIRQNRANKREEAANADRSAMIAQMLGPDNADLAGAVSSGDKVLASLAGDIMERRSPKPRNPFEFEQMLEAGGYQPGTPEYQAQVRNMITAKNDPFVTATLPTGDFFAGRQSAFGDYLRGGGDQTISPSPGPVGSPPPASAGPGVPHLTVDQMGAFGSMFPQWQKREGTPVLVTSAEEMARVPVGTMVISPDGRRGVKK